MHNDEREPGAERPASDEPAASDESTTSPASADVWGNQPAADEPSAETSDADQASTVAWWSPSEPSAPTPREPWSSAPQPESEERESPAAESPAAESGPSESETQYAGYAGESDAATHDAPSWADEGVVAEPPPSEVEAYPAAPASEASAYGAGAAAGTAAAAGRSDAHSVPEAEGATGESTQCPRCGTENRPGLSFCRNCGQRLMAAGVATTVERPGTPEGSMACPRCGTHNRQGVAFCQNCGANLRGVGPGYVPPAAAAEERAETVETHRRGAVLGPVVLLIGLIGLVTAYLLPFAYGSGSLFERAAAPGGYGVAFWNGYPEVEAALADQAYFGLAAPSPILGLLLLALAVAGFVRARPGALQTVGLAVALLWSVGLAVLFVLVELVGNWGGGDLVGMLRVLTPAGIIFFLSSLIVLIGTLTRFGRS